MRLPTIALLLALSATSAFAQDKDMMGTGEGLTMLQESTVNVMRKYNLEADVMTLTLNQLAEIAGLVAKTDTDVRCCVTDV